MTIRNFVIKLIEDFAPCFLICFINMKKKNAAIRKVTVNEYMLEKVVAQKYSGKITSEVKSAHAKIRKINM